MDSLDATWARTASASVGRRSALCATIGHEHRSPCLISCEPDTKRVAQTYCLSSPESLLESLLVSFRQSRRRQTDPKHRLEKFLWSRKRPFMISARRHG